MLNPITILLALCRWLLASFGQPIWLQDSSHWVKGHLYTSASGLLLARPCDGTFHFEANPDGTMKGGYYTRWIRR